MNRKLFFMFLLVLSLSAQESFPPTPDVAKVLAKASASDRLLVCVRYAKKDNPQAMSPYMTKSAVVMSGTILNQATDSSVYKPSSLYLMFRLTATSLLLTEMSGAVWKEDSNQSKDAEGTLYFSRQLAIGQPPCK